MLVYGIDSATVGSVIREVSAESYAGNLESNRCDSAGRDRKGNPKTRFTIRVRSSFEPGHRLGLQTNANGDRRRMPAACWHVYRDVLAALLSVNPDARLVSAQGDYHGARAFLESFEATGDSNIGSRMEPLAYRNACECGPDWDRESPHVKRLREAHAAFA